MERKLTIGLMSTLVKERYVNQIKGCDATWASDKIQGEHNSPVFYFCGDHYDPITSKIPNIIHLPDVKDDYNSASYKQWYGLRWMMKNSESQFYFLGGSDNYVDIPKLIEICNKYDSTKPFMFGGYAETRHVIDTKKGSHLLAFPLGGSGLVLTHAAMLLIEPHIDRFIPEWMRIYFSNEGLKNACDLALTKLCWDLGITISIERDMYPCSFNGYFEKIGPNFPVGGINYHKIVTCHFMEENDQHIYHNYKNRIGTYMNCHNQFVNLSNKLYLKRLYDIARTCNLIIDCNESQSNPEFTFMLCKSLVDNLSEKNIIKKNFISVMNNEQNRMRYTHMLKNMFKDLDVNVILDGSLDLNDIEFDKTMIVISGPLFYGKVKRFLNMFSGRVKYFLH